MDADANPLPSDDTTPPVTNMNFFSVASIHISPLVLIAQITAWAPGATECGARAPDQWVYRPPHCRSR
jgi:hypothetical protein